MNVVENLIASWRIPSKRAGQQWIDADARQRCAEELKQLLEDISSAQSDDDFANGLRFILSHRKNILDCCAVPSELFVVEKTFEILESRLAVGVKE